MLKEIVTTVAEKFRRLIGRLLTQGQGCVLFEYVTVCKFLSGRKNPLVNTLSCRWCVFFVRILCLGFVFLGYRCQRLFAVIIPQLDGQDLWITKIGRAWSICARHLGALCPQGRQGGQITARAGPQQLGMILVVAERCCVRLPCAVNNKGNTLNQFFGRLDGVNFWLINPGLYTSFKQAIAGWHQNVRQIFRNNFLMNSMTVFGYARFFIAVIVFVFLAGAQANTMTCETGVQTAGVAADILGVRYMWHLGYWGVLAVVQGISEALPISSSSHLVLLQRWLGTGGGIENTAGDVALHAGSLLALITLFWPCVVGGLQGAWDVMRGHHTWQQRWFWYMTVATIPALMVGGLLHLTGWERFLRPSGWLIGVGTFVFAWLMAAADFWGGDRVRGGLLAFYGHVSLRKHNGDDKTCHKGLRAPAAAWWVQHLSWPIVIVTGLAQSLAFFPGVSRLGICLTASLAMGCPLPVAVRWSFALGMAPMVVALVMKSGALVHSELWGHTGLWCVGVTWGVGVPAIYLFIKGCDARWPLWPWAVYRTVLALIWFGGWGR